MLISEIILDNIMGNSSSNGSNTTSAQVDFNSSVKRRSSLFSSTAHTPALEKLFQKLELTAESDNGHPGEITRPTFENAFHGPLHLFGKLLFRQMVTIGHHTHHGSEKVKDRITCEQFVKAGKEVLKLFDESCQRKYYFQLFAEGKEYLTREDALTMVNISYALTLSSSMISYTKSATDDRIFQAVVESLFCMASEMKLSAMEKWLDKHCPHMFCGVHNWVYTILTGSKMPSEVETAPVPQLEKFIDGKYCMSMGMLWMLSATLPHCYTHSAEDANQPLTPGATRNPLLYSYQFLMKLARLSRCQSWTMLYDSDEHGLSMNRFSHHVNAYHAATITLIEFEGRNIYCLAQDQPWREGTTRMGNKETVLLQITPVYRVVQTGDSMVLWNTQDRNLPKGILFGKTAKSEVLNIPASFDSIKHYGVSCDLSKVEIWGCGGTEVYQAQIKQKQWERKEVEKQKSKKLHVDVNWDENPDKQLLNWGGITTEHQYSKGGL